MSKLKKVEELPTSSANTILPDSLERINEDMELE
jgi:hypothetical protein